MEKNDYKSNLNKKLCEYITIRFLSDFDNIDNSQNKYSKAVGVTSSTISKISKGDGYNIPLSTIALILKYEKISLSDFFEDFKKFYNH